MDCWGVAHDVYSFILVPGGFVLPSSRYISRYAQKLTKKGVLSYFEYSFF